MNFDPAIGHRDRLDLAFCEVFFGFLGFLHDFFKDMANSFFHDIEPVPVDETFRLLDQFNSDTNPNKVNLGIGGIVQ